MKTKILILGAALCFLTSFPAFAGPYEDGKKAYKARKYEDALKIWEQAAEQGDTKSGTHLGWMHAEGIMFRQSYEEAKKWYQEAANLGHSGAQFRLAQLYEKGNGVPQSDTQALVWYRKSAKQGHVHSLYALGTMYENGKGVDQSYTQALDWYRKAAQGGNDRAQYKLGALYYYGRGTPHSKNTAIDWYKKAAASGSQKAVLALEWLENSSVQNPAGDKNTAYVIPDDVAKSAAAIFDLAQEDGVFNEQNARDLMAIYLEADKFLPNEQQTLLALSTPTATPVLYKTTMVPPRTAGAVSILNLIIRPKNLNEYWLKGGDGMRQLSDMASIAPVIANRIHNFMASKFWAEAAKSDASNGYGPIRDKIFAVYEECETFSEQHDFRCRTLIYKAMKIVHAHDPKRAPSMIYYWLNVNSED